MAGPILPFKCLMVRSPASMPTSGPFAVGVGAFRKTKAQDRSPARPVLVVRVRTACPHFQSTDEDRVVNALHNPDASGSEDRRRRLRALPAVCSHGPTLDS